MVFPGLPLERALVGGLRPQYLPQGVLGEGMDVPGRDALGPHPRDESHAHSRVLVLGAPDVVGELQLRPGPVDVGLGQGYRRAEGPVVATAPGWAHRGMMVLTVAIELEWQARGEECIRTDTERAGAWRGDHVFVRFSRWVCGSMKNK
jgi:hypothetical protein